MEGDLANAKRDSEVSTGRQNENSTALRKWSRRAFIAFAVAALSSPLYYAYYRRSSLRNVSFVIDGPFPSYADFEGKSFLEQALMSRDSRKLDLTFPGFVAVWYARISVSSESLTFAFTYTFDDEIVHKQLQLDVSLLDGSGRVIDSVSKLQTSMKLAPVQSLGYVSDRGTMQNSFIKAFKLGEVVGNVMAIKVKLSEI